MKRNQSLKKKPVTVQAVVVSDLETLKAMLTRAGREHHRWPLEWRDVGGEMVPFDGFYLGFGSEDYGPHTSFIFDASGKLVEAYTWYNTADDVVSA